MRRAGTWIALLGVVLALFGLAAGLLLPVEVAGVSCGTAFRPDDSEVDMAETVGRVGMGLDDPTLAVAGAQQAAAAEVVREDCADQRTIAAIGAGVTIGVGVLVAGAGLVVGRLAGAGGAEQDLPLPR